MSINRRRRRLLGSATALAGVSALGAWPLWAGPRVAEAPVPFAFDALIERARHLATKPYHAPAPHYPKVLEKLDYEAFMDIHTRPHRALWADTGLPFTIEFFPLDRSAPEPVDIHVVENGCARRIRFDPGMFRYADPALAAHIPDDLGFSGFRVHDQRDHGHEWLAFKGASYFRSPGAYIQYGLSARGAALDAGYGSDETFPRFSAYWLQQPQPADDTFTLCALLEGERVTGAYRMRCRHPDTIVMDIESHLFTRSHVRRLGIAPLTSMFWYSETNARRGKDWRPEIHDSDGLAMTTGAGERIWRALGNPPRQHYSAFMDDNPRGFGLLQRDRQFDHYQDSNVYYDRRPSVWVEPKGDWGRGHVGLLELPTAEEVYDNINAFWVPAKPAERGGEWRFDYRLNWYTGPRHAPALARVVATRTGRAGKPGNYQDQPALARKFVIDFEGGPLTTLDAGTELAVRATASHGEIVNPYAKRVTGTRRWRAFFDWSGEPPAADEPVDLRCIVANGDTVLTETWMYAYFPQPLPPRISSGV